MTIAASTHPGVHWWNALPEPQRRAAIEYAHRVLGRPASPGDAWRLAHGRLPIDDISDRTKGAR